MEENSQQVTPTLYSFYGKQYDYNDLAQAADAGLNEYLSTLKRGEKDSDKFQAAYTNFMSGIKDGSITFDNGQFYDSKGRYTNSDKKYRDYYGLIANYIYGKMGQSGLYKEPEVTPWDAPTNVQKALIQEIFNSENPNVQDFLDLDVVKDGVRGITNRSARLANAFQTLSDNWDTRFTGYSQDDKTKYQQLLGEAANALRDGTIDPGDYLALSKAVGGMDFRSLLATGAPATASTTQAAAQQVKPVNFKLKSASLNTPDYSATDINYMTGLMSKVKSTSGLINILRNSFYNKNYKFARDPRVYAIFNSNKISSKAGVTATLNALYNRGALKPADPNNPNLMYIPGLRTKRGTAWVWDKANNTIAELQVKNIPYLKDKLSQVASNRKGGILYAQSGTQTPYWYSNLKDYDQNNYTTKYGTQLRGINDKGIYGNAYGNSGKGYLNSTYNTDANYQDFTQKGKDYATNVENQQYYKDFTNELLNAADAYTNTTDKSTLNDDNNLFLKWAHAVDKGLPQGSESSFFDANGVLRTSWNASTKDKYGRTRVSPITKLRDYIQRLRNDQQLADRHNDLLKEGTRYFYKDNAGQVHWVDPEVAKTYKLGAAQKKLEGNTEWTDYEILGPNTTSTPTGTSTNNVTQGGTEIETKTEPQKQPNWWESNKQEIIDNTLPLGAEASRLAVSLRTNNKIADIQKDAAKPVLKNTYELQSPVTGAFSEMQFRNRQAADLRRQAAQPYTSDASLNTARQLEANKQATDLEYQGFLADDKEIKRTQQEALNRQENNLARRTEVANTNRAAINQANRDIANIESQRLNANYQGIDNFIANNIVSPLKERAAYNLSQKRATEATKSANLASYDLAPIEKQQQYQTTLLSSYYDQQKRDLYNNKYRDKLTALQAAHAGELDYSIKNSKEYQDYLHEVSDIERQQLRDQYDMSNYFTQQTAAAYNHIYNNMHGGVYKSNPFNYEPSNEIKQQHWWNAIKSAKHGGRLKPTTQYLLNKVIK